MANKHRNKKKSKLLSVESITMEGFYPPTKYIAPGDIPCDGTSLDGVMTTTPPLPPTMIQEIIERLRLADRADASFFVNPENYTPEDEE